MRPLVISPEVRKRVAECMNYAEQPLHWYQPGDDFVPGDHPEFVVHIDSGYRCVFSYTFKDGQLYRHLSISVDHPTLFVSPQAAVVIARLFGFTGGEGEFDLDLHARLEKDGWMVKANEEDHCVVMVQPMEVAHG